MMKKKPPKKEDQAGFAWLDNMTAGADRPDAPWLSQTARKILVAALPLLVAYALWWLLRPS